MITFRDPPPLEVRVKSLKTAIAPPTFEAPITPWLVSLLAIAGLGFAASRQNDALTEKEDLVAAFANSLPREVERGVLARIPLGAAMSNVRARIDEAHLSCRTSAGSAAGDSVLTCLGKPIVRANTYTQLSIRFGSSGGALTSVSACPTIVHWTTRFVPALFVARLAAQNEQSCWRDETNAADNEWSYSTVPDRAFTVARLHGADTVSRRSAQTKDTLIVDW